MDDKAHAEIVTKLRRERDEAMEAVERLTEKETDALMLQQVWRLRTERVERERDELKAEVERLRETNEAIKHVTKQWRIDAERYRWLRTFATWDAGEFESVDAAIDAAREGE